MKAKKKQKELKKRKYEDFLLLFVPLEMNIIRAERDVLQKYYHG